MTKDNKVSLAAVVTSIAGFIAIETATRTERNTPACPSGLHATYNVATGNRHYAAGAVTYTEIYPIGRDQALLASPSGQNCMYATPNTPAR